MTIFQKIIAREIPAEILFEDDSVIAFRDIAPQAPTHIVVTSKKLIPTTNDLQTEDALLVGKMVLAAKELAKKEGISGPGYRLVMNCNADGGQSVDHIHIHLLGGRKLGWPPG